MVQMYTIFGQKVGSHYLALASLGVTWLGAWAATRKPAGQKDELKAPKINASSKEEEAFIQEFLKNAEAEDKKAQQ